ncbi:hypothetical protein [Shimazuella kribbensis]|uniref:hypothetical protein n=1 Tax=Shimazuella kribbensis TaxID=139808 RepID=UPI0004176C47|nr:hypothetical protein [Shimazuella kribbensis]
MSQKIEFTQEQIVAIEGDEVIKSHMEKNKKLMKNVFLRFVKDLEQRYESVETVGKGGTKTKYILGSKRKKIAERRRELGGNISNGAWSIPYTKNMDIMVVSVLEQGLVSKTAQILSKWCLDFGLITPKMYELLPAKYHEGYKQNCLQELIDNNIILEGEDRILNDYIYDLKIIQNHLVNTLNRMSKANIIEYFPVYKGHIERNGKTINLHEETVKRILTHQSELMEKYDVNDWYLNQFPNAKKVQNYKKEWKVELKSIKDENGNELGLDYWYISYAIILKARKKKIIRYLEKFNREVIEQFKKDEELFLDENKVDYHNGRSTYVINQAQKRMNRFFEQKYKKPFIEELGGKQVTHKKHDTDFVFDKGYYALYFEKLYVQRIRELQKYYGCTFN